MKRCFTHNQNYVITVSVVLFLAMSSVTWAQKIDTPSALADSLYWIHVSTDSGTVHAAVATPKGNGPFPAILILHGTHGFAEEYVELARRFAAKGFIGIAACWFAGRKGLGQRFITPIEFADSPPLVDVEGLDRFHIARQSIDSLIEKVIALPKIQKGSLALFGHSRGGGACLNYVLTHPGKVQALVLNSTGYPPQVSEQATEVNVPVLILHSTVDNPSDGGSAFSYTEMARRFEAALRKANKDVEVKYYEGSGHNALFTSPSQFDDTVNRISNFLRKKFKK